MTARPPPDTLTASPGLPETQMESGVIMAAVPEDPLAHAPPSKSNEPPWFNFASAPQASKAQDGEVQFDSSRTPMPKLDLQRVKQWHKQDIDVS